jgi:hypothetical protein
MLVISVLPEFPELNNYLNKKTDLLAKYG